MFAEIPVGVSFCEADCPEGFCRGFAGDLWGGCRGVIRHFPRIAG